MEGSGRREEGGGRDPGRLVMLRTTGAEGVVVVRERTRTTINKFEKTKKGDFVKYTLKQFFLSQLHMNHIS